jgi:hypothetical protein
MNANRKNSFKAVTAIVVAFFLVLSVSPAIANTSSVPVSASKSKSTNTIVVSTHKVLVSSGVAKVALTVSPARVGSLSTLTVSPIKGSTIVPSTWTLSFNRPVLFLNKKVSTISSVGAKINIKIGFIDTRNIIVTYKGVDNKGKIVSTRSLVKVASINGSTGSPTVIINPIVKPTVSPFVSSGADSGIVNQGNNGSPSSSNITDLTLGSDGGPIAWETIPTNFVSSWAGYIAPRVVDLKALSCKYEPAIDKNGNLVGFSKPGDYLWHVHFRYALTGGNAKIAVSSNPSNYDILDSVKVLTPKDTIIQYSDTYSAPNEPTYSKVASDLSSYYIENYFMPMNWDETEILLGRNSAMFMTHGQLVSFEGSGLSIPEGLCK